MFSETQESQSQSFAQDLNKNSKLRAIVFSVDVLTGGSNSKVTKAQLAQAVPSNESTDPATTPQTHVKYDQSKEIRGISDVKTKYMRKLQDKLQGGERSIRAEGSSRGDAAMLSVGRRVAEESDKSKAMSAGAWMLAPGMGALLDYCRHRTLQIGRYSPQHKF
jgi:hypothetical protein